MKSSRLLLFIGIVLLLAAITVSVIWALNISKQQPKDSQESTNQQSSVPNTSTSNTQPSGISLAEVSKHTGRDGNSCWVVVDNVVYEIGGFALWVDGIHSPSGGLARCGKDLSDVITKSPHGKSKLKLLKNIGSLQ